MVHPTFNLHIRRKRGAEGVGDSKMLENKTKKRESVAQRAIFGSAGKKKFSYVNMILEEC